MNDSRFGFMFVLLNAAPGWNQMNEEHVVRGLETQE